MSLHSQFWRQQICQLWPFSAAAFTCTHVHTTTNVIQQPFGTPLEDFALLPIAVSRSRLSIHFNLQYFKLSKLADSSWPRNLMKLPKVI